MEQERAADYLVVVGSSAGGVEALPLLLGSLPAEFRAPIVVAQHVSPDRPSHLAQILSSRTQLRVVPLAASQPLRPGHVYVVPPDQNVVVEDGQVLLADHTGSGPKPSIDALLATAAAAFGERLIAVILTGSGTDGAAGARFVHQAGGTVVVQDPRSAAFPSMPQSIPPNAVDVVASLEAIAPLLQDLVAGTYLPAQPDDEHLLQVLLDQLRDRSGIDFSSYKRPTIARRLRRRLAATGNQHLRDYLQYIRGHPGEYERLVSSFLINVTQFFRDAELFDYLRDHVLPRLIEAARPAGRELRIWSAGCSTGEEAYSLAILVSELLGGELPEFTIRIFATDLDHDAVNYARRGLYPPSVLSGIPPELLGRYFTRLGAEYAVHKTIRGLVVFGQHDLAQRSPFPRTDLVLCRNVLIYFTPELQKRALHLFAFSLRDGGYLVLGKAETTTPLAELFALEHPRFRVYRRHGSPVLIPPSRFPEPAPLPVQPFRLAPGRPPAVRDRAPTVAGPPPEAAPKYPGERAEAWLSLLPVGVVVVNRRYDIQFINGAARVLLGIHGPAVGEDLVHQATTVPSTPLRSAIDAAFRGQTETGFQDLESAELATGQSRFLAVRCLPQRQSHGGDSVDFVLVVVEDVTHAVLGRQDLEARLGRLSDETDRLRETTRQLTEANARLLDANRELTAENAELRSANEELLVSSEEVQAATEEVETLNEELQATNEELETLNEELQATVEELNTTNDDLEARSVELQDLAVSLETKRRESDAERARLVAILGSLGDAVLVVDEQARPVLTNPSYDRIFGPNPQPQDGTGAPLPDGETLLQRAAHGEEFELAFTLVGPDGAMHWYEARGVPIRDDRGGVVVIRDITERSLRRLQEEFVAMVSHELRGPLAAIQASLQLLLRGLPPGPEPGVGRYADIAQEQIRRLGRLVEELLDASRARTGQITIHPQRIDLVAVIRQVADLAQGLSEDRTIRFSAADASLLVDADPDRLQQVVQNLVANALVHAPESQTVDLRVRAEDDQAVVEVQDYGRGLPPSDLPYIFDRFYRSSANRHGGLGLGLHIAREIATAHGGSLEAHSTEGQGTSFRLRLPLAPEQT